MSSHPGLIVRDLVVGYGRRPAVLNGIDADIEPGTMVSMLGPNGSGKSTLLHALLGLIPVRQGSVRLRGEPLTAVQRTHVGFCADDLPLPSLLTGREFLRFSAVAREVELSDGDVANLFEATNMAGSETRLIREYSHGMKRKLMLLANILHSPSLLILDEPFRGLDPEAQVVMRTVLNAAAERGSIVLISTHDLAVAARISDNVLVLDRGRIRFLGAFSESATGSADLADTFAGIVNSDDRHAMRSEQLFSTLDGIRTRR
ncbi:ABC transporter ATP-binding protein [Leifsonia sp. NCR5]|uniref:ABC transporter ATP-binding protein n=1 Tax=Leifsonia sp. NCR5 TaxID=1978342 RepID=UPI000A18A724|nr:ABC transporter ATP-binding protein [Leifsonia sp. NCR5]